MAIDIQQPNYSGLVAIAGKSAPLNIQPTGVLGLQALQQSQANEASLRDDAARRMALQQQGQLGLLSNQTQNRALDLQDQQQQRQGLLAQNELGLKQQQLGMQDNQFNQDMSLKQAQLGSQNDQFNSEVELKNRLLAEQTAKDQMAKLVADNKQSIQDKGAFASYGLLSMSGAKSPEEAAQIKAAILEDAGKKKYMTPEELKAAAQMPISQFQNALKYKVMQFGQVKEYKDMVDASKENNSTAGTQITFNEDGSIASYSSSPTQATKTELQKAIKNTDMINAQITKIKDGFDPDYFTYRNKAGAAASAESEKSKGIPLWEDATNLAANVLTGKSPEERKTFLENRTQYMNNIEQLFNSYKKEITGAAAGEKELEMLRKSTLNGDQSPSEAIGALDQLVSKYKSESTINKNSLNTGVNTSTLPSGNPGLYQYLKAKGYSDQEIGAYLNNKGN